MENYIIYSYEIPKHLIHDIVLEIKSHYNPIFLKGYDQSAVIKTIEEHCENRKEKISRIELLTLLKKIKLLLKQEYRIQELNFKKEIKKKPKYRL